MAFAGELAETGRSWGGGERHAVLMPGMARPAVALSTALAGPGGELQVCHTAYPAVHPAQQGGAAYAVQKACSSLLGPGRTARAVFRTTANMASHCR